MPLPDNPIFQRELHRRFRGPRFLLGWVLGYSLFLALVVAAGALGLYFFKRFSTQSGVGPFGSGNAPIGQYLSATLFFFQRWFFFFTVPGLAAAAITTEKEKKTLHMMIITSMTPTDIMLGKLASLFLFIGILIISSIPITMLTFQFGSVSWIQLLGSYGALLLGVMYYVGCGIGASGMCQKTSSATMVTYGLIAALYFASNIIPTFIGIAYAISQSQNIQFWMKVYPWFVLTTKVIAGVSLLYFGWYKVKNFELVG